MKLQKSFFNTAIPGATYRLGTTDVTNDNTAWQTWEALGDIQVAIDSRLIQPGELFIPLPGANVDGHVFLEAVLKAGACGSLIGQHYVPELDKLDPSLLANKIFIIVPDVYTAFLALARQWRAQFTGPVVGITGSMGKTSTKEMVKNILDKAGIAAYASYKNFNTLIGISYNLLRVPSSASVVIQEVGISVKGEMREDVDLLRPNLGIITCIAPAHVAGLGGSLAAVCREKRQLFSFFSSQEIGIINGDQKILESLCYSHPIAKFGIKTKNQVQARRIDVKQNSDGTWVTHFMLKWYNEKANVCLQGNHPGILKNALAAATVAYFLKAPLSAIISGLETYKGFESRFEQKNLKNGGVLFNDCYNANPDSMKASLNAFAQLESKGPKIAVLGDMLELGEREIYWHRHIGRFIAKMDPFDALILVGKRSKLIEQVIPGPRKKIWVADWQEAHKELTELLAQEKSEPMILVKASHGIALDNMVKLIVE
jgi:UDP-N-acetylmuramoyl-tripeptide--D-alanyl-D-alanine ligase